MQGFMITLLTCSFTMSMLALFYMAITPLLAKRYSAKGLYYAWLIIVIGLIIPFRPQLSNAIFKVNIPSETVAPIIQLGNGTPITALRNNVALPPTLPSISWWQIAVTIWLIGMIVFLTYHIIKHCCFVKMTRRWSESVTNHQTLVLFQSLKAEMGISTKINLYICRSVGSPMMIGFTKPRILLPKGDFTHDELRFILKHELVHFKRNDLLYKHLVLTATAIHWFNPVVHLMAKAVASGCELSCDTQVVQNTNADTRQHYIETIIGVVKHQSKLKTVFSTNFYGGKDGMKKRIFSIMDTNKKKTGAVILCCALTLTLATGMAYTAGTNSHKNNSPEKLNLEPNAPFTSEDMPSITSSYEPVSVNTSDANTLLFSPEDLDNLQLVQSNLEAYIANEALQDEVTTLIDERGLVISLTNSLLFESGKADVKPDGIDTLLEIAAKANELDNYIRIEGHTDNVPISSVMYQSNWELSAARASRVVRLFIEAGVNPQKLVAVGYADTAPIGDNNTVEGREQNRRIDIITMNMKYSALENQADHIDSIN